MNHLMKVYFHTCQYLFTAYRISEKCFRLKCLFYQTFGFSMFSYIYSNISKKKTELLFCFWLCDSRVIIVTILSSLESADWVSKHVKFILCNIIITYTHSAACTAYRKVKIISKVVLRAPKAFSLSLSISLSRRKPRKSWVWRFF